MAAEDINHPVEGYAEFYASKECIGTEKDSYGNVYQVYPFGTEFQYRGTEAERIICNATSKPGCQATPLQLKPQPGEVFQPQDPDNSKLYDIVFAADGHSVGAAHIMLRDPDAPASVPVEDATIWVGGNFYSSREQLRTDKTEDGKDLMVFPAGTTLKYGDGEVSAYRNDTGEKVGVWGQNESFALPESGVVYKVVLSHPFIGRMTYYVLLEGDAPVAPSAQPTETVSKEGYGPYTYTLEWKPEGYAFDLAKVTEKTLTFTVDYFGWETEVRTITVIELHPDCAVPEGIWEEFIAGYAFPEELNGLCRKENAAGAGPDPEWTTAKEWFEQGGYSLVQIAKDGPYLTLAGTELHEAGATPVEETGVDPAESGQSYASTQTVTVDGQAVSFPMYALKDENGDPTNYIKLRDLADALDGTAAQFNVTWSAAQGVGIETGKAYTDRNGTEGQNIFTGDMPYTKGASTTLVDGAAVELQAFVLTDTDGGQSTYYKLRDLGKAIGFNVGWSDAIGVFVESDKPYDPYN